MPEPGTKEFIEKYPFQIQEYRPYREWQELRGGGVNYATVSEAITVMNFFKSKLQWKTTKMRVMDMRTMIVAATSKQVEGASSGCTSKRRPG